MQVKVDLLCCLELCGTYNFVDLDEADILSGCVFLGNVKLESAHDSGSEGK